MAESSAKLSVSRMRPAPVSRRRSWAIGGRRREWQSCSSRARLVAGAQGLGLALAYGFSHFDKILWLAFKIAGVTFGSLLGVFLLGLLTTRPANRANVVAMVVMALVNLGLLILSEMKLLPLGWSWLVIWGTAGTMALAWALGPRLDRGGPSGHP